MSGIPYEDKLKPLFLKARQTIPFPLDVENFYLSLFPPIVRELNNAMGEASAVVKTTNMVNLRNLVHRRTEALVYVPGTKGDQFMRLTFKTRLPIIVSGENNTIASASMAYQHPEYETVLRWYDRAVAYDDKLMNRYGMLELLIQEGGQVMNAWPNLCKVLRRRVAVAPSPAVMKRLDTFVPPDIRTELDEFFATATLMPDLPPSRAWVGLIPQWEREA